MIRIKLIACLIFSLVVFTGFVSSQEINTNPTNEEFSIIKIKTINHNLTEANFVDLSVETNQISNCSIKLESNEFVDMLTHNNEFFHNIDDFILNEGENIVTIQCKNSTNSVLTKSLNFSVNLTELKKVMLLENIGNYNYKRAFIKENISDKINIEYVLTYYNNFNNNSYDVEIYNVSDGYLPEEVLEEAEFNFSLKNIGEYEVYFFDEGDGDYEIAWIYNNLLIGISVNNFGEETPSFSQIAEVYLNKYPSKSKITKTSPRIILMSPEDDYNKKVSSSLYKMEFRYKVNTSETNSCSLIINGSIKETKANIQKDIENLFSIELNKGEYLWQIKCNNSYDDESYSEIRELNIKKKSSDNQDFSSQNNQIEPKSDYNLKKPEAIILSQNKNEEKVGNFEKIINWIKKILNLD